MHKKSPTLTLEHLKLRDQIICLKDENQKLRRRLQKMQDAMHLVYKSKKKYKNKFKEVKLKLDILQTLYKQNSQQKVLCGHFSSQKNQKNRLRSQQNSSHFLQLNNLKKPFNQSKKSYHTNIKQDLTANTLRTLHSTKKSSSKQPTQNWFFRNKSPISNNQSNIRSTSLTKEVGKILKFKPLNQYNAIDQSSDSQQQNYLVSNFQSRQINILQKSQYEAKNKEHNILSNYGLYEKDENKESKSMKELVGNLISQLRVLGSIKRRDEQNVNKSGVKEKIVNVQKQRSQILFRQKLNEVLLKLSQIEHNQQKLMSTISQHELRAKQGTKISSSSKNMNTNIQVNQQLNNSFLKAIEQIGQDLTDWRIDYGLVMK